MKENYFTHLTFTDLDLDGDSQEFTGNDIAQVKAEDNLLLVNTHWGDFPVYGLAIQLDTVRLSEGQ